MAKLYAEITSDKGGRKVSKSDDRRLVARVWYKNTCVAILDVVDTGQKRPHVRLTKFNS